MRGFGHYFGAGLVAMATIGLSTAARAEGNPSATVKGTVGGALLGGETVMLVEAAAGVKPAWAYVVGGVIGAAGGGVGGLVAEKNADPRISLYLLVGGMALIIPTTVAVLSASAYEPVNYVEDRPAADEPVAEPAHGAPPPATPPAAAPPAMPEPTSRAPSHRAPVARAPALPPALVGWTTGTLTVSVPAVEVRQMYTRTEIATLGVKQRTEVSVPVFNAVF